MGPDKSCQENRPRDKCPCMGCERRVAEPNCHDRCAEYGEWRENKRALKAAKGDDNVIYEYEGERNARLWRRLRWKRDGQK